MDMLHSAATEIDGIEPFGSDPTAALQGAEHWLWSSGALAPSEQPASGSNASSCMALAALPCLVGHGSIPAEQLTKNRSCAIGEAIPQQEQNASHEAADPDVKIQTFLLEQL